MATVSASLRMFDQMTRPLQQVTQALNLTISAMQQMNNAANRDIAITNTLNAASQSIHRADAQMQQLVNAQDNARNSQERLNQSFNTGSTDSDNLSNKISKLVKSYLGFEAAKQGIKSTIGGAMRLQQQLFTLQGIMGNSEVATAYFDNLQKKANESVFGFEDFAANARKFMQFTKNTDTLDKLANLSERLTLMDPSQGLEGAGFALKEMMSGDGISLKERFGFGKADIEILKATKDMSDFISKFDLLLNKKGFTEKMVEQYNKSAAAQFDNLQSNFKTAMAKSGERALEALNPLITRINEAFSNGSFQSFFNSIGIGLSVLSNLFVGFIDIVQYIGVVIQNNWCFIEPILIAIILYMSTMLIPILWDAITTLAAMAIGWMMVNWPILLLIGTLALFIYFLMHCGVTAQQICGFIGGAFGVLWASIYNGVAFAWNQIASFAEFFANVFNHPLYSVKALFANIWNNIVSFVGGALESIVGMIKKIPFLSNLVGGFSANSLKVNIGPPPSDYWKAPKMQMKSYTQQFGAGYNKGVNIANGIGNVFNKFSGIKNASKQPKGPDLNAWNKKQGPGELAMAPDKDKHAKGAHKHLKNIDDKIDVSNEHLEMLRDLAQQESVQNFTTLSPTVNIQTGDIREEADINKIISKIESYMEGELVNSAEGVYN